VIAQPDDAEQVHALARAHGIAHSRIWLMPEGRDPATLRSRMRWLADICLTHGYALTDRLHIHLYGDTRGT
jgi:7-carboxy-7-deazaguanine synthase